MNWIRRNEQPRLRAMALARTVLPVPGTSSIEQVPAAQEGHQGQSDFVMLADDDAFDVGQDAVAGFLDLGHRPLSLAPRPTRRAGSQGGSGFGRAPRDSCVVGG